MTLKEAIESLPFDIEAAGVNGKDDFIAKMGEHLAIAAVKAEAAGEEKLTEAVDTFRKNLRGYFYETLSPEEKTATEAAMKVVGDYIYYRENEELL